MDERGFPLQESQSQSADLLAPGYFKLLPPSSFVHYEEYKPVPLLAKKNGELGPHQSSQSPTTKSVRSTADSAVQVSMEYPAAQQRSFQPSSKGNTARKEQELNNHIGSMPVESIPLGNGLPETGITNRKSTGKHSPLVCKAEWEAAAGGGGESNPFSFGKSVLLSSGKRLHSSIPSLPTKTKPGQKQDMETVESLKYDNYYNYAVGVHASATTKREWEYISDEPGEKLFEQSLVAHQSKVGKHLEYYNSVFAKHDQSKQASKPISSQKTALSTPRHCPKSAGQTSTRSLQGNTLIGAPPIQPKCKTGAPLTSEATTLVPRPLQNIGTAKSPESRALQVPHLAAQTNCDEPPQSISQSHSGQSKPSSSGPLEAYLDLQIASGSAMGFPAPQNALASPRRQPQACAAPHNDSSRPPLSHPRPPLEFQLSLQIASGALNNLDELSDSEDEVPVRCKETGEMAEQHSASDIEMVSILILFIVCCM